MGRRYEQYCPVARALELVGERWTLLVARELLLGPRRFTDLMAGLPGISTNVLAARLHELEEAGMVTKRSLPPPAASAVYELTDHAVGLAATLAAMAEWGMTLLGRPRKTDEIRARWLVLGLAVTAPSSDAPDHETCELRIDDEVLNVRTLNGRLQPQQGPAIDPHAVITTRALTLARLARGDIDVDDALADHLITIEGDPVAARRLLDSLGASRR